MQLLLSAALLAQALIRPVQGHVSAGAELAVAEGVYALEWGFNCEDLVGTEQDVEVWRVDVAPDQVVLAPLDEAGQVVTAAVGADGSVTSQLCSAWIRPVAELEGGSP